MTPLIRYRIEWSNYANLGSAVSFVETLDVKIAYIASRMPESFIANVFKTLARNKGIEGNIVIFDVKAIREVSA